MTGLRVKGGGEEEGTAVRHYCGDTKEVILPRVVVEGKQRDARHHHLAR